MKSNWMLVWVIVLGLFYQIISISNDIDFIKEHVTDILYDESRNSGNNYILTEGAATYSSKHGIKSLLLNKDMQKNILEWTIIKSPSEEFSALEMKIKNNLDIWYELSKNKTYREGLGHFGFGGAEINAIFDVFRIKCEVPFQAKGDFKKKVYVETNTLPLKKRCEGYVVLLAVNGIQISGI